MPSLELAAGQVLTAAHTNTYWMRQVIATGLSSAHPTGYEGRAAYDTDTDALVIYTTATTGWRAPWNLPWGIIGAAQAVGVQGGIGSGGADLTGLSVSFTSVPNRRYRIRGHVGFVATTGPISVTVAIVIDGVTAQASVITPGGNVNETIDTELITTALGSGTHIAKLAAYTTASTITTDATSTKPCHIYVEDIGPSAAPA